MSSTDLLSVDLPSADLIVAQVGARSSSNSSSNHGFDQNFIQSLEASVRSLKMSGSLFLVLDWQDAYHVRPMADAAFGSANLLRNEIIWTTRERNSQRGFQERHYTVLWYVKDTTAAPFVRLMMPRSLETRRRFGDGRIISATSARTGRRVPTRVEGASTAAPLNDVWVWDCDRSIWLYELDEIEGRAQVPVPCLLRSRTEENLDENASPRMAPETALLARLVKMTNCRPESAISVTVL